MADFVTNNVKLSGSTIIKLVQSVMRFRKDF